MAEPAATPEQTLAALKTAEAAIAAAEAAVVAAAPAPAPVVPVEKFLAVPGALGPTAINGA